VSCLAEQAKILFAEAEENNLDDKALNERFKRWNTCSLCEQRYHGVVACALGWACWKTYLGRPERDSVPRAAMNYLGGGLMNARLYEDALPVKEAELAMKRRIGASEASILVAQANLSSTYHMLGRPERALSMRQDVYSGRLKLCGEEHTETLLAANNCAASLNQLRRFEEARALLHKTIPVARRVLGDSNDTTLRMRWAYAQALYADTGGTLDDLREAVTTLEDLARIARRVFGGANPLTTGIEGELQDARAVLRARETPPGS
jgi:hypothetical protein